MMNTIQGMDIRKWYLNQAKLDAARTLENLCFCSNKCHNGQSNVSAPNLLSTPSVSPSLHSRKNRYLRETDLPYKHKQAGSFYGDEKRKPNNFTVPNIPFPQCNISPMATPHGIMQDAPTLLSYNQKYLNLEDTCEKFTGANMISSKQNISLMITPRFYMHDVSCMHLPNCQRGHESFPTHSNGNLMSNNSKICNEQHPQIWSPPGHSSHYPAASFQLPYMKPPTPCKTDNQYVSLRHNVFVDNPLIDSVAKKQQQMFTEKPVQYHPCLKRKEMSEENKRSKERTKLKGFSVSTTVNSPNGVDRDQTLTFHAAEIDEGSNQLQVIYSQPATRYKTDNQYVSLRRNLCVAKPIIDSAATKPLRISTENNGQYQPCLQKEEKPEENKVAKQRKTNYPVSANINSQKGVDRDQTLTFHAAEIDVGSNPLQPPNSQSKARNQIDNHKISKVYNICQARSLLDTADVNITQHSTNTPGQYPPCRKNKRKSEEKGMNKKLKKCSLGLKNMTAITIQLIKQTNKQMNQTINTNTLQAAEIEVGRNNLQPSPSKPEVSRKTDYNTVSTRNNFRQTRRLADTVVRKIPQIGQLKRDRPYLKKEEKDKKVKIGNKNKLKTNSYSVPNNINLGNATGEYPIVSVKSTGIDPLTNNLQLPYFLPAIQYKDINRTDSRRNSFCEARPLGDTISTKVPKFSNRGQPYQRREENHEEPEIRKMKKTKNYLSSVPSNNNSRNSADAQHILPVPSAEINVRFNNFQMPHFRKQNFQLPYFRTPNFQLPYLRTPNIQAVQYKTQNNTDNRRHKFFQAKSLLDTVAKKIPPISTRQPDKYFPVRKNEECLKEERKRKSELKQFSSVSTNIIMGSPNATGVNHNLSDHSAEIDVGSRSNTFQNVQLSAGSTVLDFTTLVANRCNQLHNPYEKSIQYQNPGAIKPSKFSMTAINALVCQAEINAEGLTACPLCKKLGRRTNLKSHIYLCQFEGETHTY